MPFSNGRFAVCVPSKGAVMCFIMKLNPSLPIFKNRCHRSCASVSAALLLFAGSVQADQVQMQNGDHYVGRVLSVNTNALVLQSDVLGTITLSRDKVASITLGSSPWTNVARAAVAPVPQPKTPTIAITNNPRDLTAAFRQMRDTNAIK